jgi:hypothetical protein
MGATITVEGVWTDENREHGLATLSLSVVNPAGNLIGRN